jgi:hypothetical protein
MSSESGTSNFEKELPIRLLYILSIWEEEEEEQTSATASIPALEKKKKKNKMS